ncbi:DUF2750 domain-containing protein [Gilvimarinus agarilyticus]|uniref:DUF2750 domain-containing protein n=1 Tax=unclassified Gilvimarinus TaxID=2642066 RepID=UPI001C09F1F4|nr:MULTISPECIES: DUF2750 domain-containing protein [unclassified Gilvimarinus]MBU2886634.1 DUF2750 domain-containing protein [Gilvimarinus agarilyticus]MDO6571302.1 DUF2750 domain-containing protein [Gilvimarinus sp. 2_MG-2023]MDO6746323.1 DUF2750 domain-containing protein [Gilvimarinus sp. 1_MG-2023]
MEPLSDDFEENADRLIVESIESGCVWGLEGPDGWALCDSDRYQDTDVMPLWSDRDLAAAVCVDEWKIYKPVAIALEELLEEWLPGMHDDVLLVGLNWTTELEGDEWEPLDLLAEFEAELQ